MQALPPVTLRNVVKLSSLEKIAHPTAAALRMAKSRSPSDQDRTRYDQARHLGQLDAPIVDLEHADLHQTEQAGLSSI
jgi:hypothetical protein